MFEDWTQGNIIEGLLDSKEEFEPFVRYGNREFWDSMHEDMRDQIIRHGETLLDYNFPPLLARYYMEYKSSGNRRIFEKLFFDRRDVAVSLALAECAEGKGRFIPSLIDAVWLICEETSWCVPAHNRVSLYPEAALPEAASPVVDLFASDRGAMLAWLYYLLGAEFDKISPLVTKRIESEVSKRVLEPFYTREDFPWMGFVQKNVNNWNPWCLSNCIAAILLLEYNQNRRAAGIKKSLRLLESFINMYHPDGGCDEGASYWSRAAGSLFDCLDIVKKATRGRLDGFTEPLVKEMGRFIYRMHIHSDYFCNFADSSPRPVLDAGLIFRYGREIQDNNLAGLGTYLLRQVQAPSAKKTQKVITRVLPEFLNNTDGALGRILPDLECYKEMHSERYSFSPYAYLAGIQVMTAREHTKDAKGFFAAAKGGHNGESHNHNDVGNVIVYYDGEPVLCDVGVGRYTAKTFSPERYEIWTMQSGFHNLPTVNGFEQSPGREFMVSAVESFGDEDAASIKMDLARAYPKEAGMISWMREVRLDRRSGVVSVSEDASFTGLGNHVTLNFLTPIKPRVKESVVDFGKVSMTFHQEVQLETDQLTLDDELLTAQWGECLYRIRAFVRTNGQNQSICWSLNRSGSYA